LTQQRFFFIRSVGIEQVKAGIEQVKIDAIEFAVYSF
jgi:hypothetical protein